MFEENYFSALDTKFKADFGKLCMQAASHGA